MEQKLGPKDIFLHLLAIATLYASAISLTVLLFQYINLALPSMGRDVYYYREGILSAIRFSVSTLIVVFPVYFWVSRLLRKMYEANAERKNLSIRKWLAYFTLFLSAAIAIGWLVRVINNFLEGDFTTTFLLKALVIFFVTGSIAFYYRAIIRGEENKKTIRGYGYFVALIVLVAIAGAFFSVGSPADRRMQKNDTQRVYDLQNIQGQIGEYYRMKGKMPASLADIKDAYGTSNILKDPGTGKEYEYIPKEGTSFELCADFSLPFNPAEIGKNGVIASPSYPGMYGPYGSGEQNWQHDAGRKCFDRTLDAAYFAAQPK